MSKSEKRSGTQISRRQMLSLGAMAGVAAGVAPTQWAAAETKTAAPFPTTIVAALADLEPGAEIAFAYPDEDSPAVLIRFAGPVDGGIGPDQSIVAYSTLCTHKGCQVAYNAERQMLICPCHWSSFDPAKRGRMIIGQASQGLPQITLRIEAGAIEAVGVEGLIYGRHTNIL
jgi:arsenite oxidase small subunit